MTAKTLTQKAINEATKATYFVQIPLCDIFNAVKANGGLVVDEAGNEWSGLLCGRDGQATFPVVGIKGLRSVYVSWYTMPSGKYEVIAYAS